MEDAKIIDLFFLRSETAVTELDQKYGTACKQLAFHILNNREDAEECVNDAYLAVWNTIPPNRPALLRAYLCRIVRNLSIKKYRANTAEKRNSFYDRSLEELAELTADFHISEHNAAVRLSRTRAKLRTYFGESAACVYQKNSQILNLSQTVDGWTMTLTDCIGDDNRLYVGIEVTAPEGTVLMEQGVPLPYGIEEIDIDVGEGARHPGAWYISQIPDDSETDNHLRFVLWMNCQESLDGKNLSLTLGKLSHGNGVCDFDGSWSFQDIQLDLADQSIRLEPQVSVPVLDTTATLTELTISPVSITCCFRGEGLIGQCQRYPNGTNITDPAIALYDRAGNVMQLETRRAPLAAGREAVTTTRQESCGSCRATRPLLIWRRWTASRSAELTFR